MTLQAPTVIDPAAHAPRAVLVDDGRAGHLRQSAALVRALGLDAGVLEASLRQPWRALAPRDLPLGWTLHRHAWRPLPVHAPRLIVSCGRRGALAGLWLRTHWQRRPKLVQVLDSGRASRDFDAVIVPRHDRLRGDNVITMVGSLNPVDADWLRQGAAAWPEPGELPEPRLVVLLGGPARGADFTRAAAPDVLARWGRETAARGGSLVLVATPRTPSGWLDRIADEMGELPLARLDWPAPEARYAGALAHATHLLVSAESSNLLSEACATGRPVAALGAGFVRGRRVALLDDLRATGALVPADALLDHGPVEPLRETPRVAAKLRDSLGL